MNKPTLTKNRTLPTIIGIITPVIVLVVGILFIKEARIFQSSANSERRPQQIKIGNITDNSFVVSWIANEAMTGSVVYGESPGHIETSVDDLRDKESGQTKPYLNHFVLLENLKPNTKIYYRIMSAGVIFDDDGQPYTITTATKASLPDNDIAQGRILNPDNSPADGALIYFSLANTSPLIGITDETGHWMIPLSTARLSDLGSISNYDRNSQVIDLIAVLGQQSSSATLTTKNDNPTPDIVLGQTYNFVNQYSSLSNDSNDQPANESDQITMVVPETRLVILYPAKDNEKITASQPEFIGFGPAGESLEIVVHSADQINDNITVGSDRSWRWSPTTPLSPGEHTITVSYTDKEGFVNKVTKSFFVTTAQAAENDFLPSFTATGSGRQTTPVPTQTPQPTPLQPTVVPTSTTIPSHPTAIISPEATVTISERTTVPTDQAEVPTSGNWLITVLVGSIGVVAVIAGLAFLIF